MANIFNILANLFLAKLEKILKEKTKNDPKMVWPILFKCNIDDGFGIKKKKDQNPILNTGFWNSTSC